MILPATGRLAAWSALLLSAAWLAGAIFNDRHPWSQYLWWIPAPAAAVAAWAALGLSLALDRATRRFSGTIARPFLLLGAIAATAATLLSWQPQRLLRAPAPRAAGDAEIVYWNAAWSPPVGAADRLAGLDADVLIVANPRPSDAARELRDWLHARALAFRAEAGTEDPALTHLVRLRQIVVVSRWPISAWGVAVMDAPPNARTTLASRTQNGIGFATIATGDIPLHVHVVDAPSDLSVHRVEFMRGLREARDTASPAFPAADVVIGDFNTPRGSRSLAAITRDLRDAHSAAGRGSAMTWPAPVPLWAIDMAYVGGGWHAVDSRVRRMPASLHHAVSVRVRPDRARGR